MVATQGAAQTGTVGKPLPTPVTLRVVDAGGDPMTGQEVTFKVASGGGSVTTTKATSGADGLVRTTWTLGTRTADRQTLEATSLDLFTSVSATPIADTPATSTSTGNGQVAWALEPLDSTVTVTFFDQYQNPVANRAVTWTVASGGGSVAPTTPTTNPAGRAIARWTLGASTGTQTLTAAMPGLAPVQFAVNAQANVIVSGTVQVAAAGAGGAAARAALPARPRSSRSARAAHAPREWIVTFEPAAVAAPAGAPGAGRAREVAALDARLDLAAAALRAAHPVEVLGTSPAILAARVAVTGGADWEATGRALRAQPGVRSVEPNGVVRRVAAAVAAALPVVPAETLFAPQAWHYDLVGLDQAWKVTTGSASVIVAVVDDGVRFDHPDLTANLTADGYDFVTMQGFPDCAGGMSTDNAGDGDGPDSDPTLIRTYSVDEDLDCVIGPDAQGGHGAHVAGTIGAASGNGGTLGVSWLVKMRPVRAFGVTGAGLDYDVAQAILYAAGLPADNGVGGTVRAATRAHVINMSFSGDASATVEAAIQAASAAGSLLVAAAGDEASDAPRYPAAYPAVLSVSAVGPTGAIADYSSFGSTVDLAAPGGQLSSGPTEGVWSTIWNYSSNQGIHGFLEGTDMAAAHVSGVAALLFAKEPALTAAQARARLLDRATPAGDANLYGRGLLNALGSLTNGAGFRKDLYVRLQDGATGATVQTVKAGAGGSYRFARLPEGGSYRVIAGQDEEGDAQIGVVGRTWGAFGGIQAPRVIPTPTTGIYEASFTIGYPLEGTNNQSSINATALVAGGYMNGNLATNNEADWYTITLPAGTYTFSTAGRGGARAGWRSTRTRASSCSTRRTPSSR